MTREERQKAIDALKISAPVMAVTQEEFKDYIQSLNKIMDWLDQEPTTKKNLAVGYISKAQAIERLELNFPLSAGADNSKERYRYMQALADTQAIRELQTVDVISEADYENRLRADMVAMLTEIQLEIEELDSRAGYDGSGMPTFSTDYIRKKKVNELIQQKINELKGEL